MAGIIDEAFRNLEKDIPSLRTIDTWVFTDMKNFYPPQRVLLSNRPHVFYLDPPYKGTTSYDYSLDFDYNYFYTLCRNLAELGHKVYISEYSMPDCRFEAIWEKKITNSMNTTKTYQPTEKLFIVKK
jgi:DNA adenine methylase